MPSLVLGLVPDVLLMMRCPIRHAFLRGREGGFFEAFWGNGEVAFCVVYNSLRINLIAFYHWRYCYIMGMALTWRARIRM